MAPTRILWILRPIPQGDALERRLGCAERKRARGFGSTRRRREWVCARVTARDLVARLLSLPPARARAVVLDATRSGAPFARERSGRRLPVSLSIAHGGGWVACAAAKGAGLRLGVDVEPVAPRRLAVFRRVLSPAELPAVARARGRARDVRLTRLWCLKEAVLKARSTGFAVDPRTVVASPGRGGPGWRRAAVRLRGRGRAWCLRRGVLVVALAWLEEGEAELVQG
jgi:4'-phosphopantetheinyl transferase